MDRNISTRLRRRGTTAGLAWLASILLAGCGGGGGTALPAAGTTFPLQTAMSALLTAGVTRSATVSGSALYQGVSVPISGSVTLSILPMTQATVLFNAQTATYAIFSVSGTVTVASQTLSISSSQQTYFSTALQPLGYTSTGAYCVAGAPGSYPATVQLGDSGSIVSYACYSDSTMSVPVGTESLSYKVGPGVSSTTVTVSLIDTATTTSGQTSSSEIDNYLLSTGGTLSLSSASLSMTDSGVLLNMQLTLS